MSRDDTDVEGSRQEGSCQEASFQPSAISSQRTCLRRCEKIAALPPAVRKGSAFSGPVAKKRKTIKSLGSVASESRRLSAQRAAKRRHPSLAVRPRFFQTF